MFLPEGLEDSPFTNNIVIFIDSSILLPLIFASNIYDGIFHQKFDFLTQLFATATAPRVQRKA